LGRTIISEIIAYIIPIVNIVTQMMCKL